MSHDPPRTSSAIRASVSRMGPVACPELRSGEIATGVVGLGELDGVERSDVLWLEVAAGLWRVVVARLPDDSVPGDVRLPPDVDSPGCGIGCVGPAPDVLVVS
jgi:hypothetical protein